MCTEHEVVAGDGRACAERRGRNVAVAAAVGAEALLQGFEALGLAVLLPLVERLARDGDDGRRLVGGGGRGGLRGRRRRGSVWGLGGGPMDKARDLELCVLVPPLQLQSSPCGTMRAVCCELHESSASRCSLRLLLRCSAIEMGPHLRRERAHPVTSALEAAMTIEAARLRRGRCQGCQAGASRTWAQLLPPTSSAVAKAGASWRPTCRRRTGPAYLLPRQLTVRPSLLARHGPA